MVTNDEYDLLNYDPLICNITNINYIGSLVDIYITFDLNNIFFYNDSYPITLSLDNSTLQIITNNDPFPAENSLTSYNTNNITYNINIKFQKKPLMIWIWISVVMLSFGGFLSFIRNAKNN